MTDNPDNPDSNSVEDSRRPWHGVLVATALPLREDLSIDYDAYAAHCAWLIEEGCDAVVPNGSLGEYQTLTDEERATVVDAAISAVGADRVIPGVAAYGSGESWRWTQYAAEAGVKAVMLLPPNSYRADERSVREHYAAVAQVGLPIIAYNNPHDTKVDLTPELLALLHSDGLIHAVKEFSGDVRRAYQIAELAPGLDLLCGADDVLLELAIAGAKGWVAGYPNALPRSTLELYRAAVAGDLATALPLYRQLHPLLRWDSRTEFVQAIKLSMSLAGRHSGPCRPPRGLLAPEHEAALRAATEKALAAGLR